jgi:hypothetical protein
MNLKNGILVLACIFCLNLVSAAQDEEKEEKAGFKKEKLFTGGSISLSFFENSFLIGASPVFGYSLTRWADLGIVVNYNYSSYRDYNFVLNSKLRQYTYGGGAFTRLFPVRFLFAQAQLEHNWIKWKYIPPPANGGITETRRISANSFLIGGGYTTGRDPDGGATYGYLALLFDVSKNVNSPYTDALGRTVPIIRAGINIPLFQGGNGNRRSGY